MKKIAERILRGLVVGAFVLHGIAMALMPSAVGASYMCHPRCCELYDLQKWYTVEYRLGEDWVAVDVTAWNAEGAAAQLDLRAGYNCFVSFDRVEYDPVVYDYKVSFFGEDGWTVEYVQAESKQAAADMFGLRVSYDCWVTKVF